MVRSVINVCINTQYRESCKNTGISSFTNTLLDCRDVFLRNRSTHNGRLELEELFSVWIHRLELNLTVSVHTGTTGLVNVLSFHINRLCESLFVSNLGSTNVCLYLKLTKQTVYDNLKVQLSHSGDDGLSCFLVGSNTEGRIFFGKLCQSLTHLTLRSLSLRLDSHRDNRLREFHGLEDDGVLLITDGISCGSKLKSYCRSDISGEYLIQLVSLVCVHLQQTSNSFLLFLCGVQNIRTSLQCSRIHTEIC